MNPCDKYPLICRYSRQHVPIYVEFQRNSSEIQVLQCCKAPNVCTRVVYTVKNVKIKGESTIIQFNSCMNRACTVARGACPTMIRVSRAWWGEPRKIKCLSGQKQTGIVKVTQHPRGNFNLIPSHRSGGFMGNPQPRGLRQAPLVPSGFI